MTTVSECRDLERELEKARGEYNQENIPCGNIICAWYKEGIIGHCGYYNYWADDCREYIAES